MNPDINPKAKTNIKNMIRDALNCQKRICNFMTWVFWIMINKARKPKRIPKIHFKFIFFLLGCIVT